MTTTNMCSNFGNKWCSPPLLSKLSSLLLEVGAAMGMAIFIVHVHIGLRRGYVYLILFLFLLPLVYTAVGVAGIILFRGSGGMFDCFPGN